VVVVGVGDLAVDVLLDDFAAPAAAADFFVVVAVLPADAFAVPVLLVGPDDLAGELELDVLRPPVTEEPATDLADEV